VPFKFPVSDPKAVGLAGVAGLAAWKASNFSVDPSHLTEVALAALTGGAVPHNPTSRPDVESESHIVTPYANNIESEQ
jgi:hypothetical protein